MEWFSQKFIRVTDIYGGTIARDNEKRDKRYLASTFPNCKEAIQPGDLINGGLALHLSPEKATLYQYTLRLWCANGMMRTQAGKAQEFNPYDEAAFDEALHEQYHYMAEQLKESASLFRQSLLHPAGESMPQYILQTLNALEARHSWEEGLASAVLEERALRARRSHRPISMLREGISRFDLINAVTAMARDEKDPRMQWELEKLGGQLLEEVQASPHRKPYSALAV